MIASVDRASRARSRRLSLMRGASWMPLAAMALVSHVGDARAQAVNLGGAQPRIPTAMPHVHVRSSVSSVPAGVQAQSPGNSIVTDGQTATNVRVNGNTTTVTTSTMSGGNAFNSFKTFSAAEGNTVNLIVPNAAGKLVNIVREGPVNIQGTLNSYQNGRLGGNVVFADSYGIVVGAKGSVNVGSLTVVTPNKATMDAMISGGKVNDGLVARVITGDVPLSADGSVVINGRVNAQQFIKITATDVKVAGSLQAAQRAAEQKAQFAATVNTRGWKGGGQLVAHGGSVSISGANSVDVSGSVRAGSTRHGAGTISVASNKSVHISGSLKADGAAGRNGGKIDVKSGGDIAVAGTAKLSVSGQGKNSSGGEIVVKADQTLNVADGASFTARGGTTGDGGFVELSGKTVVTEGKLTFDLGATSGRLGTVLIDPVDLIIGPASKYDDSHVANWVSNANAVFQADNSITLAANGIIDTRSSTGAGNVTMIAQNITLLGGSQILADSSSGGTGGTVTLTALATTGNSASVVIGDAASKDPAAPLPARAVVSAQDLMITATATPTSGNDASATVLIQNADVKLERDLTVSAKAGVNATAGLVTVLTPTVLAAVDVLGNAKLKVDGLATLAATADTKVTVGAEPNAATRLVADAAAAVILASSKARVHIGDSAEVTVKGALNLTAQNTVASTSSADGTKGGSSAAGASVAVNILTVETSALIDGAAKINAGSLALNATSSVTAATTAKATAQGAGEAESGSKTNQYLSDDKYKDYEKTSDGGVKAAGALAIADLTSTTLTRMGSSEAAKVTGATELNSVTFNTSKVIADGSSATGANGVGVAVGVGLSHVSNQSLLEQSITSAGLTLSATMKNGASDNAFSVTATSGAAASNVGVAGALATNLLDSESAARLGPSAVMAILGSNRVSLKADDLSSATAMAGPSGTGAAGDKVGIGASVALNLVGTRSIAELADKSSVSDAGDVTLQATSDHIISTKAEQGSEGGVAVTPVLALTMASDWTRASIGALTNGLTATGDISVTASQHTTALTQASGTAAGGKAGIGAALAIAVLDEQSIATTSSSISTAKSVSFTAEGVALAATAAVASASGGKETDQSGNSTDGDASVDDKIAKETGAASSKQGSAKIGDSDQRDATTAAAKSETGQGKTSDGSVAVAAAGAATVLTSKVQAYVPVSVGITSKNLSITSTSNVDARTSADGSAVGSDSATAKVGVGVGLSINLVRTENNALLGAGTSWSTVTPSAQSAAAAGQYVVSSLSLKAGQDDLKVTAPVVTVKSAKPVDASKLAQPSITASGTQRLNVFESNASAGAGASSVGVAGAVALNLVDTQSVARLGSGAKVTIAGAGTGLVSVASDNESSTIARAMPAGDGAAGGKVGVGASVALNLVATRSTAELADGAQLTSAGALELDATGVHGVVTQAAQGSKGGVSITPVIAMSMVSDHTTARIGALTDGLDASGDVSVAATQLTSALTQASGSAAGGQAAIGAALAVAVLDEQTTATTATGIRSGTGGVSFAAQGASLSATAAVASASGGNGADGAGKSTDKDGSVDDKVQKQTGDSKSRMSAANVGDGDQVKAIGDGDASAKDSAKTSEGGVAVAAAIAVDVSMVKVNAYVPVAVGISAAKTLSVTTVSNVDVKTSADGATTAAGSTKAGVGAAVAVNVVDAQNVAVLGFTPADPITTTQLSSVTAGTYSAGALEVAARKTDLKVASPVVVGGATLPASSASTATERLDQIVAYAKSGSSGADVGVAGSLAVNLLTSASKADVLAGTVTITAAGGDVSLAADSQAYVAAYALPAQDGASGSKVGVGASVALNTALTTSEASLANKVDVTGAHDVAVAATTRLDTDARAEAGAKGGTALDAVVAFTILDVKTTASIESGGNPITATGTVSVSATSSGTHNALALGSSTSSGSGGTAIGGAVALITGTGIFDALLKGGPITTGTSARIARDVSADGDIVVAASGTQRYAASATATAGGGSGDDKGAAGGSNSTSSKTLGSTPAQSSMDQEQKGLSDNKGGSDGGKLSVAAALGAAIVGDSVNATVTDSLQLAAKGKVSIGATSTDEVQSMGNASAASSQQDNGIGVGAALSIVGNTTAASIGNSVTIVAGGDVGVSAKSAVNNGLGGFTAEAMSGASGKKLAVAGALAIGISNSTTSATMGDKVAINQPAAGTPAGAVAVTAENTSSLAVKAWSGSYSAGGTGIGASIAAAISNDSYKASIGDLAAINAASVAVNATNKRVDDLFSSIKTLAQPVLDTLADVNDGLKKQADNISSLAGDVSKAGVSNTVDSFKSGFVDQINADKDKIIATLKLARDLPILGSNNFYTEVIAGAASTDKLAISGGLALQIMLAKTSASIGTGATINATGAVSVAAKDAALSRTLVGALAASGGTNAAGISLGIILNQGAVNAGIGQGTRITNWGAIGVDATADRSINLFEVAAGIANSNGIAGILGVIGSTVAVDARVGTGSTLTSDGALSVSATNKVDTLNLAGNVAIGGNNGIGGVAITTAVYNTANASIDSSDSSKTTVKAKSVGVSASTVEQLIDVAVAGSFAGSNAIAGVATPLAQAVKTMATIGVGATVTATDGDVTVSAADNTLLVNIGGVAAIGGNNGVGGSLAVGGIGNTVQAAIGYDAAITATGAVSVTADARETISDAVVSGAGGGSTAVAGALASSVVVNNVSATIGDDDATNPLRNTKVTSGSVRVAANDSTLVVDIAGSVAGGGSNGVGAGVDANVLTKNTIATIARGTTVTTTQDVIVQATSSENVYALVAGFAAGGSAGVAGSVGTFVLNGETHATIAGQTTVTAQGNVAVIADDKNELNRLIGTGAVGGSTGVGAAIGVSVVRQNTTAAISDGAVVDALGLSDAIKVSTGIAGSFGLYGDDVLKKVLGDRTALPKQGDINAVTTDDALLEGALLLAMQRTTSPVQQSVHGVAVAASATSTLRSITVSGAASGSVSVTMSGDLPVVINTTEATIGKAKINQGTGVAGAEQSVTVAASSDLYHLGVAGSVAGSGSVGVGAGAETAVITNTTHAAIGAGAIVSAARNVAVTANASENFAGSSVSAGLSGSVGVAGGLTGFAVVSKTKASIDSDDSNSNLETKVRAGGNVIVAADDETRALLVGGSIGIGGGAAGVGIGLGLSVVVKTTEALIGNGADVTALGNGANNDLSLYTGEDFSATQAGRGLLVQANSGQSVSGTVLAGAGGLYAGVAGAVAAEVFVDQTRASIGANATINKDNTGAFGTQDVTVTARNSTVVSMVEGSVAGGIAGVGGAVDVAVIADASSAIIQDGTSINVQRNVTVAALTNRQTSSAVVGIAAGIGGATASISVLAVANGPDADQQSKMNGNGSFYDDSNVKLQDGTINNDFLSTSTNDEVRKASKAAQDEKAKATLQPNELTGIAAGNSATIGVVKINAAQGDVNVRAADTAKSILTDGAVAATIGAGAGIGVGVINVNNTATITTGADIESRNVDVMAASNRSLIGTAAAATAAGGAAALMSLTDLTSTAASINGSAINADGSAAVRASNSETVKITTLAGANGVAGGLSLLVLKPTTTATIDGASTIVAAAAATGKVTVSAANSIDITSTAAGLAAGGGGGVGLTVISETPVAEAKILKGASVISGKGAIAGSVEVKASTTEKTFSTTAGVALGDGVGGALTVLTRGETTNATIEAATIFATGNVGVIANSTSTDDLLLGGGAVGGGVGIGGSLGVSVLSSNVTALIDAKANVTALGLGTDIAYDKAYQTTFGSYVGGDSIKSVQMDGIGAASNALVPLNTDDVTGIGATLLLSKGTLTPVNATARGVVVNAAKGESVRSIAVSGAATGGVSVGLSGNVPVIANIVTAKIGDNASINQDQQSSAGLAQSVTVGAANHLYSLNIVGAAAAGAAAGVGASLSTVVVTNQTYATIGNKATVSAKNNVIVSATASEDLAMIAAAGGLGGVFGLAGGLSLTSIDNTTRALIDQGATVTAGNNAVVFASDSTREATFAGSIAASGGGAIGGAVSVGLIKKSTKATIDTGAHVSGLASGTDTFNALTGADLTATKSRQGILVDAESVESNYVLAVGAAAATYVAAAGAISVDVFNIDTLATINSGAVINDAGKGNAKQDVAVVARDLAGVASSAYGVAGSLIGLAGAVDVGVFNTNVGASIGDATVNAGGDVAVNAIANKAINSKTINAAVGAAALSAGVSVYSIGNGLNPNGDDNNRKALDELKTANGSDNVTSFAGSKLSVGNQLASNATNTTDAANKTAGSSTVTTEAGNASAKLKTSLGTVDVSGKTTAQNAAVAGTSATIGTATINANGAVLVNGVDKVDHSATTGGVSAGVVGAGAGVGVFIDSANVTATITGGNSTFGKIDAGQVAIAATAQHTVNVMSYAGSLALLGAVEANVAIVSDYTVTRAGVTNYTVDAANGFSVDSYSRRQLSATTANLAVGLGVGVGISVAKATVGGSVSTDLQNLSIGSSSKKAGAVTAKARSGDTATASATAAAGGIGGAGSGAEASATVTPSVALTLTNDKIYSSGAMTLLALAEDSASATASGLALAGGLAVGGSVANATLTPNVQITLSGGSIEAASLQADAQALSKNVTASATGASGALIGISATSATATDNSQAVAAGSDGSIVTTGALNFNAKSVESTRATASGFAGGVLAIGANTAVATTNRSTSTTLTNMSKLSGNGVGLNADSQDGNTALAVSGSGGVIAGASASARTSSYTNTVAQISGGATRTVVDAGDGTLSLVAHHAETIAGSVDSTQAAVVGASGARLSHDVFSGVTAGIGDNVAAQGRSLTIDAANSVTRAYSNESNADLSAWDVKSGSGGFIDAPAATGNTNVTVTTIASIGVGSNVHLVKDDGTAKISASNDVKVHQKTKVDSGGLVSVAGGEANANVRADATVAFKQGSSLIVDIGDVAAAAWSNVDVDTRVAVSSSGFAGAPTGAAKANVLVNDMLSLAKNVRVEASNGVMSSDGITPTRGTVSLYSGRDLTSKAQTIGLTTVVDLYNNTAIPIPTKPDAQSNLTNNVILSIAQSDKPDEKLPDNNRYGVNAAGDINVFADQGNMSTSASGTGTNIYLQALSKTLSAISNFFGGGDVSFDIKGGSTSTLGTSTLTIDGIVDTGIARNKSLTIKYQDGTCNASSVTCVVREGNITSTSGTFRAGGAILDRLGQIDALMKQYVGDTIAIGAYASEQTFLQAKLVSLGLATGSGSSFKLNAGVTEGVPAGAASAALTSLTSALNTFRSEVTTSIGTVLGDGLTNIALAWNGTKLDGSTDTASSPYSITVNTGAAVAAYQSLSTYEPLNSDTGSAGDALRALFKNIDTQVTAGNGALGSARDNLKAVNKSSDDITAQVNTIIGTQQDVAQGLKTYAAVQTDLGAAFNKISTDQGDIKTSNTAFLGNVQAVYTASGKIGGYLSDLQGKLNPTTPTSGDATALTGLVQTTANITSSANFINVQIAGGTLQPNSSSPVVVTGLSDTITNYAKAVDKPASGNTITAWKLDLDAKAQAVLKTGVAGDVGKDSVYVQLDNTGIQLGNVNIGAKVIKTETGTGQIVAPGDAGISVINETAATLKIQNLYIPNSTAGHITANGVQVQSGDDISHVTGAASGFAIGAVKATSSNGGARIDITSNYNPESAAYYATRPAQVAPDIILLDTGTINNLTGSVSLLSAAGNIYIQGKINANSISIIARNGDLVSSYVNGFTHVGGDPAGVQLATGKAVAPADPITTGLGMIANGQIFLSARYLNINSTVQSGIADWSLNLKNDTLLVTTDATKIGMSQSDVNALVTTYNNKTDKKPEDAIWDFGNGVKLNMITKELTFSIATARAAPSVYNDVYKFYDSQSQKGSDGVYTAQVGASYDAVNKQVVVDGTSVRGGFIQIYGQVINTSNTGAGKLNVLDGFGSIKIDNQIDVPVVLSTVSTGADLSGVGRGTEGKIDIVDVHLSDDSKTVNATHTVFTRGIDAITGQYAVQVAQEQGVIKPVTGVFEPYKNVAAATRAVSTGDRTGEYDPLATQRYVYMTTTDYTEVTKSGGSSTSSTTALPGVQLLNGSYVSVDKSDGTPATGSNGTPAPVIVQMGATQTATVGASTTCDANCAKPVNNTYYEATTDYRKITTNSIKADYPILINFIGSDSGTINIKSSSDITLKGNVTNVAGTTSIETTKAGASIIQSSINPTITAQSINLTAMGSVGGVASDGPVGRPIIVSMTNINGTRGVLNASAADGVVAIASNTDLLLGQIIAGGDVTKGKSVVTLNAGTDIRGVSGAVVQADRVSLTAQTGSIGSVAKNDELVVNTGFTTDPTLRPFGDTTGLAAVYGLSASAGGDINIHSMGWDHNKTGSILANSIVSSGGDVKLTTAGQILDGNPSEKIDTRTYNQLVDYWTSLGLTQGNANQARQDATIQAYKQSQDQAYRQYWQIRLGQADKGAVFDPNYQVIYTPGTAQYQSLKTYYEGVEKTNNGGTAPLDIDARVAADIVKQAADDTARYRALNGQVGGYTASYDASFDYKVSDTEKAGLTRGATWSQEALGFPITAGALKTLTNTNPIIKAPNVSGRNVTILAAGGIGETMTVDGQVGLKINPTDTPFETLTSDQKVALAAAERSDLILTVGGVQLPPNATAAQITAYQNAVAAGIVNTPTEIRLGVDEAQMTPAERAALDAAAAGIAIRTPGVTYLTVLSKRPLNVASDQSFNATVTAQPLSQESDQGKAFVASRGDLALGTVDVTGETRIKAIGSLTNAAASAVHTGNIVLESANGSIGLAAPLVLNLLPQATITARALNGVSLYEKPGTVNGSSDAWIDTVYSPNSVQLQATGSIFNANSNLDINVLGGNIWLTADTGSIGSALTSLNVGTSPGGSINAAARFGLINLYGVSGLDFTIGSALAGTSARLVAAVDGTIAGPVTAGSDLIVTAGSRLVLTGGANVISAAGDIQMSANTLKMLRNARVTATSGSVRMDVVRDALVSNVVAGSTSFSAIDITAGGHIYGASDPARAFDLSAIAPGAGIRLTAGLGIGDATMADLYAKDQTGMPVGSADLVTQVVNPLRLRTNAITAASTVGDINLITLTNINAGSVVTGGGNIDIDARGDFRVSNVLAKRDAADNRGHVVINARGDIDVGTLRGSSLFAETPRSAHFGDATVDNPAIVAADIIDFGVLHASGYQSTPLIFQMTGYHGGIGTSGKAYVDAPQGVVMPLLREQQAAIRTNALDYAIVDGTIGQWMSFNAPLTAVWMDNRTPRPVLGFDVQLFQPLKQFYMYQNGVRTFTNAAVVQYSERAEVLEWRNGLLMPGGSMVRDDDRIATFTGVGSVILRDDSPDFSGPFFRGDAFIHFMEALRDRGVRRPIKGPVVNLKGLASTTTIGD